MLAIGAAGTLAALGPAALLMALRLRIEQNYQEIDVQGAADARLRGNEISWQGFHGRVHGGTIVGDDGLVLKRSR